VMYVNKMVESQHYGKAHVGCTEHRGTLQEGGKWALNDPVRQRRDDAPKPSYARRR
jgi:hypothetical protein